MRLFSKSSKVEHNSAKSDLVLNKDSDKSENNSALDIKSIVSSIFDGKPNPAVDDSRKFRPLSSMQDWEKKDEIEYSLKMYNYIKTGEMFPIVNLNTDSMPSPKLDDVINEYRSALDLTDNLQDGIIGSFEQGKIGDCGFLSSLKVIASTKEGAKTIKDSIRKNHDKTFSVRFLGAPGKIYNVSEKELTEGKEYSTGDKDVKILEIAANKWRMETKGESLEGIDYPEVKKLITGKDYMCYSKSNSALVKYKDNAVVIDKKEFLQNIPEGRFVFGSLQTRVDEKGDSVCHAYFVKKNNDNLLFFNPHNTVKDAEVISIDKFVNMENTEIDY